jgi:two-component system, OmpR family, phosphate regulon sensor histidine kinase PhoR
VERGIGRSVGLALALATPGGIVVAALFGLGFFDATAAIVAAAALLALSVLLAIPLLLSLAGARAAIDRLGPDAAPGATPGAITPRSGRHRRLSLAARAVWPAVLRLRRSWQEHAARAEARLAAAEAIIAAVPDPLILIDRQRRVAGSNAAAAEFIGPGAEPGDLASAIRNPLLLAAADAVLRGEPVRSVEFTLSVPIERVLRARFARIADRPGDARTHHGAAAILTLHDVTELKRTEQMRADFIANAGHELKTPLATLIGFIETLLGPAREDAAARERFLGIMREQAGRMARLVDDLLSLSRIELNEHVAPTGRVALAPVIDEVARGLELRAGERGIRIARMLPADLPAVQGDRDELAQIFQNLIDNAVKYARPHSEVTVTGAIGGGASASLVRVAVADQGDGIANERLPRLTERFYRVDTARSRELGGTGLGLAIVKHILNRHRGRLDIASEVGQGSTFTVWLRVADPAVIEA